VYLIAALGVAAIPEAAALAAEVPQAIAMAVADSHRPPEQSKLDPQRKPAQVLAFAGVHPGDRVADFMPGNAYFTRLLSAVVGPKGHVYAFIPKEEIKNCPPAEIAGSRAIEHDPAYRNVAHLSGPVDRFATPRRLDVIWTAQNYHDLHDAFLGPADIQDSCSKRKSLILRIPTTIIPGLSLTRPSGEIPINSSSNFAGPRSP
jgi:predicted methyltransferase